MNQKYYLLIVIITIMFYSRVGGEINRNEHFRLKVGDLLFQDSDCGPFCQAIEKVTVGYNGSSLSHVGIVVKAEESIVKVIEALSEGVKETPLDEFLNRSFDSNDNPKVLVGRVKPKYDFLIKKAVEVACHMENKAYDKVFDISNDDYYCSELIYVCFMKANEGKPLFDLYPMTFKDPATDEIFPIWKEYFSELREKIPEGRLGLNPGSISRSNRINIVHVYGYPAGWKK